MATYSKEKFSGSTNGKGIKITQTATKGDVVHTAVAGTSDWDEVWLYAVNSSASDVKVTVEWGQVDAPDGNIEKIIPAESGLFPLIPGLIIQNGLEVTVFAASANVVIVHGFVNRITS